jgi:hypothetical protein
VRLPPVLRRALFCFLFAAFLLPAAPGSGASGDEGTDSPLLRLPSYEVTEHSPVIRGRQDDAFRRALASAFRKVLEAALRDLPSGNGGDSASWQMGILSRASDFIASYQVLSHDVREGYLTLTVRARVSSDRLQTAVDDSIARSAELLVRMLVDIEPFAMMGTSFGEDFDAGHEAASALQVALLKKGVILVPAPEKPAGEGTAGRSLENRISLATAAARKSGADYVLAGRLNRRTDSLLVLDAELISVKADRIVVSTSSPVELQPNVTPQEYFAAPAEEIAALFLARLK